MDFRQRIEQSRNTPDSTSPREPEGTDMCEYFAISRGVQVICLELRLADGKRVGIPYVYLNSLSYDPERGIEFGTSRERVTITGRSLAELFDHLLRFRVRFVQENLGGDAQEDGLFIERIMIEILTD